jgi:hypothetical protein
MLVTTCSSMPTTTSLLRVYSASSCWICELVSRVTLRIFSSSAWACGWGDGGVVMGDGRAGGWVVRAGEGEGWRKEEAGLAGCGPPRASPRCLEKRCSSLGAGVTCLREPRCPVAGRVHPCTLPASAHTTHTHTRTHTHTHLGLHRAQLRLTLRAVLLDLLLRLRGRLAHLQLALCGRRVVRRGEGAEWSG